MRTDSPRAGLAWTGAASAVVALLGMVVVLVVARASGPEDYASFAVLWGLFFGIGGVFAGLQQEVTRAVTAGGHGPLLAPPAVALGVVVGVVAGLLTLTESGQDAATGPVMAVGLAGLAGLTFVSGVLAARSDWRRLVLLLVADAVVRTAVVVALVAAGQDSLLVVGIVAGAVGWLPLLLLTSYRTTAVARGDSTVGGFVRRSAVAMGGTGCAALLVSGVPLIAAVVRREPLGEAGALLAALVLVRSALLVPVYGSRPVVLRSLLDRPGLPSLLRTWAWVGAAGAVLTLVSAAFGPWLVRVLLGDSFDLSRSEAAVLALSAVGIAFLVYSGLALVALDRHAASTAGWAVAVVVTVACMPVGADVSSGLLLALLVGPWTGVAVHLGLLVAASYSRPRENADSRS